MTPHQGREKIELKKVSYSLSLVLIALLSTSSFAGAPDEITYQGRLLENGAPAGAKSVTFELFEAASGGTRIWFQTQTVTPDDTGIYNVTLGSGANPIPADRDALWLQVKVGGSTLSPRTQLTSSTYALNVGTLPTLDVSGNATIDGNVGIGTASTSNALEVLGNVRGSSAFYTHRKNMGSPTSWTNIYNHGEIDAGSIWSTSRIRANTVRSTSSVSTTGGRTDPERDFGTSSATTTDRGVASTSRHGSTAPMGCSRCAVPGPVRGQP